ncbi:hypothetical protein, partial [Myxococcus xanthus]|uniref:hypothetical protein n=1 Tax=Myxococcus xanthus TaxID=34 RepID=UPI001C103026
MAFAVTTFSLLLSAACGGNGTGDETVPGDGPTTPDEGTPAPSTGAGEPEPAPTPGEPEPVSY